MTATELKTILDAHALYLRGDPSGKRANLSGANLRNADLSYANLRNADLSYANLTYADLSYANLTYADLSGAYLTGARRYTTDAVPQGWKLENGVLVKV